jgi:hypothetical protein
MLILEILVGVLLLGVCSFMVGQFFRMKTGRAMLFQPESLDSKRQWAIIENKLDHILMLHEQGQLPEKHYLFLVDHLIDQLVSLRNTSATSTTVRDEVVR